MADNLEAPLLESGAAAAAAAGGGGDESSGGVPSYIIPELRDAHMYRDAAIYLHEGKHNTPFAFHPKTERQRNIYLYSTSMKHTVLETLVALFYISLIVFEEPAVYWLHPGVTGSLELACTAFFAWNVYMKSEIAGGPREFFFPRNGRFASYKGDQPRERRISFRNCARAAIVLVMAVGGLVTLVLSMHITLLALVRPLLIIDMNVFAGVRRVLRQIMNSLWYIRWIMALLLLFILISAVLAFYFFSSNPDDPYFDTLEHSYVQLFILVTTANYPDVMMPAFAYTRAAPVFFTLYLLVGLYTIFNIFLAFVYGFYQETEKSKFFSLWKHRRRAVRKAYSLVRASGERGLTMRAFREILGLYEKRREGQDVVLTFMMLDGAPVRIGGKALAAGETEEGEPQGESEAGDGILGQEEFYRFYECSRLQWRLDYGKTLGKPGYSYLPTKDWPEWRLAVRKFIQNKFFDYAIDAVIVANVAYIVTEAARSRNGDRTVNEEFQYVFYAIFLLEAIIKVIGLGYKAYFSSGWNRFDFSIVFVSTVLFIIEEVARENPVGMFATVVRGLRLGRVFKTHKTFKQVAEVIIFLFPKMVRFMVALLVVFYMFAVVGMEAFAHTVSKCTPAKCGEGNYYEYSPAGAYFQLNNFDNILYSFNTLFILMVVNNWWIIMNGHSALLGRQARIFFFVYYLVVVVVVSNIVIAFILDAFQVLYDMRAADETESEVSSRRVIEIDVNRDTAATFLPADDPALQADVITFRAIKESSAVLDILFADDVKQWILEDKAEEIDELGGDPNEPRLAEVTEA